MEPSDDRDADRKIPFFEKSIIDIFERNGIEEYDMQTIQQILKFMQKYSNEVYRKADLIRIHADKKRENVNVDDVKLAIEAHNENSFYKPLSKETIENIARRRNVNPIPAPTDFSNLIDQIPESDYTLTQPNFEVYDEEIQEKMKKKFEEQTKFIKKTSENSYSGTKRSRRQVPDGPLSARKMNDDDDDEFLPG
mmetsp:Transcript_4915/g.4690  ORF Transcript_4915/g.4690 Transcript_4915/m.4690 type:complete len:194 (-) Transcript_4915:31-612(-)|eukprot:CAMPEP_0197004358 /NCGR_PEP_ID=MMETSP1380-20130617/21664_1 /TAXON_ID=5936 /ORGANISM="Euplotes crassus, Strain CT5" /LENGTH=193 /DNA_ID=CAMNT_0042423115 /DNA_START=11 /DNA_END=592 /DNA_ORIENTATION=+